MGTSKNDNPAFLEPLRKETGLVRRSEFIARRVRELAQQAREHDLVDDAEVVFPDKNLEAAVREKLGIPEGTLTRGEFKWMDRLTTNFLHVEHIIKDLLGLEHAANLTWLHIIHGQISELSPLSSLTNLTTLILDCNQISDISPVASLTNLTELALPDNQISDISPLALLTKLDYLELARNPLSREAIDVYAPILTSRGVGVNL